MIFIASCAPHLSVLSLSSGQILERFRDSPATVQSAVAAYQQRNQLLHPGPAGTPALPASLYTRTLRASLPPPFSCRVLLTHGFLDLVGQYRGSHTEKSHLHKPPMQSPAVN